MRKGHRKALTDNYGPAFLALVFLFISCVVRGQTVYRPSNTGYFTPANKPYAPATGIPTDGRTYKADTVNGLLRPYNGTGEVLTYLPVGSQYRIGQFPIIVNVGGSLQSNGTFIGGTVEPYWFLRGQADTNLVRMDSTGSGTCAGCLLKANNLSDVQSLFQTLINLNLNNVDNTSDATKNSATATLTNKSISGLTNTITNLPNSALLNNSIGLTLDTAGSSPSVSPSPAALGTSLGLHIPWAGTNSGLLKASAYAFFNGKLDSVHISNDSVYNCVNGTCTLQSVISGGTGAVLSVSNSDGSLLFSPTTGNVIGSINTAHGNVWTAQQTFNTAAPIFGTLTTNGGVFYGNGSGLLLQSGAGTSGQIFESQGVSGPIFFTPTAGTVNGWLGYTALSNALGSTHIFVGDGSNIATDVAMTGAASISNTGVISLTPTISAGSCTNCNLTYNAAGQLTVASNGSGGGGITQLFGKAPIIILGTDTVTADTLTGSQNLMTQGLAARTYQPIGSYQTVLSNTPSGGFPLFNLNASAIREVFAGSNVTIDSTTNPGGYTINAIGGGGSQTFPQTLSVGRTLSHADSVVQAGNTFHFQGGELLSDTNYVNGIGAYSVDTIRLAGTSYTYGIGATDFNSDYASQVCYILRGIQENHGISSLTLQNDAPTNPWGAPTNGVADTVNIPTYNALRRWAILEYGINDYRWIGANWDTTHFGPEYRSVIQAYINRGWPASKLVLLTPVILGQGQFNADSAAHSFTSACTATRAAMYITCIKNIAAQYGTKVVDVNAAFAGFGTPLLLAADSIHPRNQGHIYMAQTIVRGIGYQIVKQGQGFTLNGALGEFDSLKLRPLGTIISNNFTPVVQDSSGNLVGAPNKFAINNPPQPQSFFLNTSLGVQSGFSFPGYLAVTGLRPTTGAGGISMNTAAMQFEYGSGIGYQDSYNYITSTPGGMSFGYKGGYSMFGSGASRHNTAIADVNGIFNVTGASYLNSTSSTTGLRYLNGFFDALASGGIITFRTNGTANTNLSMLANSNNLFGGLANDSAAFVEVPAGTTTNAQLYLPPGTIMTTPKNGSLTHVNGHLWFTDQGTNYDLLASSGGGISLTTTGTNGAATLSGGTLNIPQYQGALTLTTTGSSGAATLVGNTLNIPQYSGGGSPGGSSGNIQFNSSSSFGGASNLNYDGTNNWTLVGNSPTVGTGTGAPVAGDLILKNTARIVSTPSANTAATGSLGFTVGAIWEFRDYFTNGSSSSYDWYTAPTTTGTTTRAMGLSSNGVLYLGPSNFTYGTPIGGDAFMPYGSRWLSGVSSTIWSSFSLNHAGFMEFKDAYSSGTIDFYPYGNGTTANFGGFFSANDNFVVSSTKTDNATATIQSVSTAQPQFAAHYNGSNYTTFQTGSTGILNLNLIGSAPGLTINTAALPVGSTSDTALVIETTSGVATVKKVLFSAGGSQTWQQALTTGSTLTGANTVTNTGQTFTWNNGGTGAFKFTGLRTDSAGTLGVYVYRSDSSIARIPWSLLPGFNIYAANGLTSGGGDSIYLGGTLNQNTTINLGTNTLNLTGTGGGIINFFASLNYNYTATSDANYTVTDGAPVYYLFPSITANRTITLPTAGTSGRTIIFYNGAPSFAWSFASSVSYLDGSTLTNLAQNTWYTIISVGGQWVVLNSYAKARPISYNHTIFTPSNAGTVNLVVGQYNIINPSGSLTSLTVNLPSSPANNDVVYIKYTQAITTVTYGNGTVVDGITTPSVGGLVVLTYDATTTSWY